MKHILFTLLFIPLLLFAQEFKLNTLLKSKGVIWGFEFVSDTQMILTYKNGTVALFNLDSKSLKPIKGFKGEIYHNGQGGLLDVKRSPDFKNDKTLYFTYSKKLNGGGATTLARAKFLDGALKYFKDLVVTKSVENSGRHFGSRIIFDNDGYLYFSSGDRGQRHKAQEPNNHFGVILQVNLKDLNYKVYSYGHRNPQGLAYDSKNNILYANEHGPRGGDEINILTQGANYGWPEVSLGNEYISNFPVGVVHKEGMIDPIFSYTPSIAPSSLMYYDKNRFKEYKGKLFNTALVGQVVSIVDKNGNEQRILNDLGQRFRNIKSDDNGFIYLSTDSGRLYRLE